MFNKKRGKKSKKDPNRFLVNSKPRSVLNKRGQIWIETVIYTLIAFVMIGIVLSYAKPKIQEFQDKVIIEQSREIIEELNAMILSIVQGGSGNTRLIEIGIKKGVLKIDGVNDKIIFEIESTHTYSQPGEEIQHGNILVLTEKKGKFNIVTLTTDYSEGHNITYQGKDESKSISKSSTPYKLFISNKGKIGDRIMIDVEIS